MNYNNMKNFLFLSLLFMVPHCQANGGGLTSFTNPSMTIDDVKAIEYASVQSDFKFGNAQYVVCVQNPPSAGSAMQNIYVFRNRGDGKFLLIYVYRVIDGALVDCIIDDKAGIVSIKTKNYGKELGEVVSMLKLPILSPVGLNEVKQESTKTLKSGTPIPSKNPRQP